EARRDRERVRAQQSGLDASEALAEAARPPGDLVDRAGDQRPLDEAPEQARDELGRPVEERAVQLVEVELPLEQRLRRGDPRDGYAPHAVDRPGDRHPGEPERHREYARDGLLPALRRDERLGAALQPRR